MGNSNSNSNSSSGSIGASADPEVKAVVEHCIEEISKAVNFHHKKNSELENKSRTDYIKLLHDAKSAMTDIRTALNSKQAKACKDNFHHQQLLSRVNLAKSHAKSYTVEDLDDYKVCIADMTHILEKLRELPKLINHEH